MTTGKGRGFQDWATAKLDGLLHRLRIPHRFWWQLCDAYDLSLGTPDTPDNFPRRHGFYRRDHIATSGGYVDPESLRCTYCNQPTNQWHLPCILEPRQLR